MATLIRVKRKKSTGNASVKLQGGEPYYNLVEKKLYIGDSTASDVPAEMAEGKKHIAQITDVNPHEPSSAVTAGDATVNFTVGEATNNAYSKTVNNVAITKGIILDPMYFGTESARNQLANKMGVDKVPAGTVFFQEAE